MPLGRHIRSRVVAALRPDDLVGHGELRKLGADQGRPFAEQRRGGKAAGAGGGIERARRIGADRPRPARLSCPCSSLAVVHGPESVVEGARPPLASPGPSLHHGPRRRAAGVRTMQRKAARGSGPASGSIARAVLAWYDRERRELPWRAAPGEQPDPYRVWLSEIMLQQTTVKAVLAALCPVPSPLAKRRGVGPRRARRSARRLGRARLLRPRAQSPCLRPGRGGRAWRQVSIKRGRAAQAAGGRRLYRRGDLGDRLRQAGNPGRRQYRARGGATIRRHHQTARSETGRSGRSPTVLRRRNDPATLPKR